MIDKIFTIENSEITISSNTLLIPELKAIVDKYNDASKALAYCAFLVSPSSPYSDLEQEEREKILLVDYAGDFKPTDKEICDAIIKLELLYPSTTVNYFKSTQILVNKLALYSRTVIIDDSRETGNIQHVLKIVEKCGNTIEQFRKLEKAKDEELRARGDRDIGYDQ